MYISTHNQPPNTRLKALGFAIGLLCSSPLFAQSNTLESIVVTAERQQTELGDIPASIFSVGNIDEIGATHVNEALVRVPGTWISRGNGQESLISIRSPVLTGAGSCGAFQMSQDGIPLRAAGFCNVNQLFEANTEQAGSIEVVRGPGSVLYGTNALHGTINVIGRGISEDLTGDLSLEVGPHSYGRAQASVSTTNGNQGVRLSFNGTVDGGYKDESGFDQQKLSFLHQFTGDSFSISTSFNATNLNQETAGYVLGEDSYKDESLKRANLNPEAFRDVSSYRLHSRIEWETDAGNWMLTPYYRKTEMDFLMHFLFGLPLEENGQESFGFQSMFSSEINDSLSWLAGVDAESTEGYLRETQTLVPDTTSAFILAVFPVGKHYDFAVDATMLSAYAQLTYKSSEQNQFTFGVRTESLDYDYDNQMLDGRTKDDGTDCSFGGCRFSRPADREDSFTNTSLQLGWVYDFSDNHQSFANVSHGFRAPQANEMYRLQSAQVVADLKSEEVDSFEVGYRASYDRVNYALSLFYMEKDNVIFKDADRNNISDGESEHKGLEYNVSYAFTDNLSLSVAGSYARHTYTGSVFPGGVEVDLDGNDVDTAPRTTGSVQLNWQINESVSAELEWVHIGSHYTDPNNEYEYDGHDLLNLRYHNEFSNNWFLGLSVTNLLDTEYAERADFSFGNERYFVGEPRGVYLTVGNNF